MLVPGGPRGQFGKDFRPFQNPFWDDFLKVFGRISMLGLIVFKVVGLMFWGRWLEISPCCSHPFGDEFGVVLCIVCHDLSHVYSCFDKVFASWSCTVCVMISYMCSDARISHFESIAFMR